MWLAYLGLIVLAHVRSIRVGREGSICVLPCRTHIEITYVSPSLGPYGQPIWDWLCFLMCDSYGSAIKCPYVFTHSEPIYRSTMWVLPWAHVGSIYGSDCACSCVTHMGLAMRSPYVFTHSEPIYRSTMWVLPWAHVGSLYGSDCVCSCENHMGCPWGPYIWYSFSTHTLISHKWPIWDL